MSHAAERLTRSAAESFRSDKPDSMLVIGEGPDAAKLRISLKGRKRDQITDGEIQSWLRDGLTHYLSAEGFAYLFPAFVQAAVQDESGQSLTHLLYLLAEGSGDQFAAFTPEQFRVIDNLLDYAKSEREDELKAFNAIGHLEIACERWSRAT